MIKKIGFAIGFALFSIAVKVFMVCVLLLVSYGLAIGLNYFEFNTKNPIEVAASLFILFCILYTCFKLSNPIINKVCDKFLNKGDK